MAEKIAADGGYRSSLSSLKERPAFPGGGFSGQERAPGVSEGL